MILFPVQIKSQGKIRPKTICSKLKRNIYLGREKGAKLTKIKLVLARSLSKNLLSILFNLLIRVKLLEKKKNVQLKLIVNLTLKLINLNYINLIPIKGAKKSLIINFC